MQPYKTNSQPIFVLYRSPDMLRYLQQAGDCPQKELLAAKTRQVSIEGEGWEEAERATEKRHLKDDYQKNITINVVKCCIRQMLSKNYQKMLRRRCEQRCVAYEDLIKFIEPVLKEVVISLGDLKKLLTSGDGQELRVKRVFGWFLGWYLRHKYMSYLLNEGKMNYKERYIEYKNKYILYLLEMIRQEQHMKEQQSLKEMQQPRETEQPKQEQQSQPPVSP